MDGKIVDGIVLGMTHEERAKFAAKVFATVNPKKENIKAFLDELATANESMFLELCSRIENADTETEDDLCTEDDEFDDDDAESGTVD